MLLMGVDEAGKGPVVGSMFVAGFVIDDDRLFDLAALGVKDSKQLSPSKRESLFRKLMPLASDTYVVEVPPAVIDELRQVITMNEIMVRSFAKIVGHLKADRAVLDAADVNAERFRERVRSESGTSMEIIAEHRADENHQVVSAASIIAKVRRDRSVRDLEEAMNCRIGSGYPTDPDTLEFLSRWVEDHGDLPPCARRSWATSERIKGSFQG